MGVAPYSWPHEREWKPGLFDKRANLGMYFILFAYSIFYIGFSLNAGLDLLLTDWLVLFLFMTVILGVIVVLFILGQTARRDVKVEDVKYFDIPPDRLSEIVLDLLGEGSIHHDRDGPHVKREDYWLDTLYLRGQPWDGITVEVERNPLIARVDIASITVRGMSRSMENINVIEERIDGAVMKELLERYEKDVGRDRPDLVVYGDEKGGSQ
jgi:hypothetical protein